jgi:uncharacterized Tic20 family protein
METVQHTAKRVDRQLLVITHLSQLLTYITGFGGLIVPLVIWLSKKDDIINMDKQGRDIINFQISMILWAIISIPLIFLFGLGILTLIAVGILSFILPIVNAVRASDEQEPIYFMTIKFL